MRLKGMLTSAFDDFDPSSLLDGSRLECLWEEPLEMLVLAFVLDVWKGQNIISILAFYRIPCKALLISLIGLSRISSSTTLNAGRPFLFETLVDCGILGGTSCGIPDIPQVGFRC